MIVETRKSCAQISAFGGGKSMPRRMLCSILLPLSVSRSVLLVEVEGAEDDGVEVVEEVEKVEEEVVDAAIGMIANVERTITTWLDVESMTVGADLTAS